MTINDWIDFNFECFPICNCSECIYKYACEQSFHCGAEVVSEIVAKCKTYEEVISYINKLKNTKGKTWSMACSGKGMYERQA